jgi:RNA polymerase-binding transcription factor DksA
MEELNQAPRYSDEDLEMFRQLISEKLATGQEELNFMKEQLAELSEDSNSSSNADLFDDSNTHGDIEMLSRMIVRQQQFVRNLEAALVRVKNKSYGICTVTGNLIDKKRLMLVPHATKSITGKEEEKKQIAKQPFGGSYNQNPIISELRDDQD